MTMAALALDIKDAMVRLADVDGRGLDVYHVIDSKTGEILAEYDAVSYRILSLNFDQDRWIGTCVSFQQAEWSVRWWVADLINYGSKTFGEMAYQAVIERRDWSHKAIQNWCWIADVFKPWHRNRDLSIWMHGEVAPLALISMEAAQTMMATAVLNGWKRTKLRAEVQALLREKAGTDDRIIAPSADLMFLPDPEAFPPAGKQLATNGQVVPRTGYEERDMRDLDLGLDDAVSPRHCQTCTCYAGS